MTEEKEQKKDWSWSILVLDDNNDCDYDGMCDYDVTMMTKALGRIST